MKPQKTKPTIEEVYKELRIIKKMIRELSEGKTIQEVKKPTNDSKVVTEDTATTFSFANRVAEIFEAEPTGKIVFDDGQGLPTGGVDIQETRNHAAELM